MVSDLIYQALLKDIAQVETNFSLGSLNVLGVGGPADYFTIAHDTIELAAAVKAAMDNELPYLIVGQATTVLFSDAGYAGLVIQNKSLQYVIANDRSQMVVDSGMPLQRFITHAANQGFGGLIHLYREAGTVGGALYANSTRQNQSIISSVRHVTVLMPPTKMKVAPTIVRQSPQWLLKSDGESKLKSLRASDDQHLPVILNVQFQLTSVRSDELLRRIAKEAAEYESGQPKGAAFGPIFHPVPGITMEELLSGSGVAKLKLEGMYPDKHHPNYLRSKGKSMSAQTLRSLIDQMAAAVQQRYAVELIPRLEFLGTW
jgi:UDP-N-acetylmuramate dehydrogenase